MAHSLLTIVTPAAVTALAELAAVKMELGISGTAEDAYLTAQIANASAAAAAWCGRVFAREVVSEVWRPTASLESLALSRYPVASISSVVEDGVTLAATDYELNADAGMLWRLSADERTTWSARKITVAYTGGYLLPGQVGRTLPADVERACILMVAAQYNSQGRDPMLRSEGAQGIGQVSYLDPRAGMEAMPPQAAALLWPYRSLTV